LVVLCFSRLPPCCAFASPEHAHPRAAQPASSDAPRVPHLRAASLSLEPLSCVEHAPGAAPRDATRWSDHPRRHRPPDRLSTTPLASNKVQQRDVCAQPAGSGRCGLVGPARPGANAPSTRATAVGQQGAARNAVPSRCCVGRKSCAKSPSVNLGLTPHVGHWLCARTVSANHNTTWHW
jgi:hypothetical protein